MPLFQQAASSPFGVRVVDEATGRGVPLVELETVNRVTFVTDSGGWAAISDPGLRGTETYFHVRSHGYSFPKDGFGYSGVRLTVTPGAKVTIKLRRVNIAERICRLTGEGIYADSVLLNESTPLRDPVLSGKVVGQDSALAIIYQGKMIWFWGDTMRPNYPLGNYRTTGAVATFPKGRKEADAGLDFQYFTTANGFVREMCPSAKPGPIWIGGTIVLKEKGREILLTHYARMKNLGTRVEHGLMEWDDSRNVFRPLRELPLEETWRFLEGHPLRLTENGTEYILNGNAFPLVRVPAVRERILEPAAYEAFTCLSVKGEVQRDNRGVVLYKWQRDAPPMTPEKEAELVKQGKLTPDEARFLPRDSSGATIIAHGGSVTYSPYRKKWLLIATQKFGKESALGEIFYAEADHPTGPWRRIVKIITHDRYTFYNPVHHPFLDAGGGRIIYLEGTYTAEFSGNPRPTPRYDYNQMLYRLDLTDSRLNFAKAG